MADKFHRRPVAPGGFTQAPLTTTAVWRGITNSLATTAAQVAETTPGLLAKASAGTKVVLEQNRQLWIDPLSEAMRDIAGDAKDAFRPGARRTRPPRFERTRAILSEGFADIGRGVQRSPRPSPSVAAPVRDASRARAGGAQARRHLLDAKPGGRRRRRRRGPRRPQRRQRPQQARGRGSTRARARGRRRDLARRRRAHRRGRGRGGTVRVVGRGPNDGSRRGDGGPNDGSRLGDGGPNDPSVAAGVCVHRVARNRSFLDDVDRSGLAFWGSVGSFLTFSAVVAWRRHVAAATAGMNEEGLGRGGERPKATVARDCRRPPIRRRARVVGNS